MADRNMSERNLVEYDSYGEPYRPGRLIDDGHYDSESYRQAKRTYTDPRPPRIDFEEAALALARELKMAVEFFIRQKEQFDRETEHVRAYADPSLIDMLWTNKLSPSPKADRSFVNRRQDELLAEEGGEGKNTRFRTSFKRVKAKLQNAIHDVLNAVPRRSSLREGDAAAVERTKRAFKKVQTACRDCEELLKSAKENSAQVSALITELNFVLKILTSFQVVDGSLDSSQFAGHGLTGSERFQ